MSRLWNPSFPFEADYNDHFETPIQSYQDILPVLDFIAYSLSLTRSSLIVYDPFYCNGQAKVLLESLGFVNVKHDKRDFYKDVQNNTIPPHHVMVTNPPYSEDHKERIIEYTFGKLRTQNTPFFLLMPNYVAIKEYFRNSIRQNSHEKNPPMIYYIIPATRYQYYHPEGTGKTESPFDSIWYCGLPESMFSPAVALFQEHHSHSRGPIPRLAQSIDELKISHAIPTSRRRNPKRRRKEKARIEAQEKEKPRLKSNDVGHFHTSSSIKKETKSSNEKINSSRYRDEHGIRKKRRF